MAGSREESNINRGFQLFVGQNHVEGRGGTKPLWSAQGDEIFYRNGNQVMSVSVRSTDPFDYTVPRLLFEGSYGDGYNRDWNVAPDGQRFLMMKENEAEIGDFVLVLNFFEELERLVPQGGPGLPGGGQHGGPIDGGKILNKPPGRAFCQLKPRTLSGAVGHARRIVDEKSQVKRRPAAPAGPSLPREQGARGQKDHKRYRRYPQGEKEPVLQLAPSGDAALGPEQKLKGGKANDLYPPPAEEVDQHGQEK